MTIITWSKYKNIVQSTILQCRPKIVKIDWNQVRKRLSSLLQIPEEKLINRCKALRKKYYYYKDRSRSRFKRSASENDVEDEHEIVLNSEDFVSTRLQEDFLPCSSIDEPTENNSESKKRRKTLHFRQLSQDRLRIDRVKELYEAVCLKAKEEDIEFEYLIGFLLKRHKGELSHVVGDKIINSIDQKKNLFLEKDATETKCKVTTTVALAIYSSCLFGRQTYSNFRKILNINGLTIFPSWYSLRQEQKTLTPEVRDLPEPYQGKYFSLQDAVTFTYSNNN